jgi:dipeptidyl aminopeptidase/acylaminoacyl peptidase
MLKIKIDSLNLRFKTGLPVSFGMLTMFKRKKSRRRRPDLIIFLAMAAYLAFFGAGYLLISRQSEMQTGQFIAGEEGQPFNRSLDLRAAAKNVYPSSSLTVVRDLGASGGVDTKIISFKVPDDGLIEYGLMTLPASKAPKNGYPAIILCHGYESPSQYMTTENYIDDMDLYTQHGFAVIKPDYRGQGLSMAAGKPNSAFYSMDYNTDVMSLISALKKTSYIDKHDLNLFGHSMGAYIALRAAVLSPDIKSVILLSGPVDSLSKMYLTYIPSSDLNNLNALRTRNDVLDKYGIPAENSVFWKNASPITLVSRIKAHVQIHVGELDQVVPPEFSADLDKALSAQHISHQYYVYPDGEHSLSGQRTLIWGRSLQLLVPSGPATPA